MSIRFEAWLTYRSVSFRILSISKTEKNELEKYNPELVSSFGKRG
ncbi:hypothetical protein LEP1GSC072_2841 [Leptospira noguchii str. Bonito]|nr:hypothetical protein LEP1GSC072_2841 [Leptospira noguchii str. Bonito]